MAGTVTVRETLRRVSVLLQDINTQFYRWAESELVDWLNDGQAAIAKYLPQAGARVDSFKCATGSLQSIASIPAANLIPSDGVSLSAPVQGNALLDVLCNMGSDGMTEGAAVRVVDRKALDAQSPTWRAAAQSGTTVRGYVFNPETPRSFSVTPPVPAGQSVWLRIAYLAQPVRVQNTGAPGAELYLASGSNATVISIADEYVDDLVNYIVARAHMKQTQWAEDSKAAAFANMFVSSINAQATAMTGVNPNLQRLPLAPAPMGQAR